MAACSRVAGREPLGDTDPERDVAKDAARPVHARHGEEELGDELV